MGELIERRRRMLEHDLKGRGIRSPEVLAAMAEVPREEFVPEAAIYHAYDDYPLPIEEGQTISQPYIVAYMAEALEISSGDTVLEIGTGSGYSTAVLSRMADTVYTVEQFPRLAETARERLLRLRYRNVVFRTGDGTLGWPEHAPFAAIVVTAGAPEVPKPLLEQLAIGGRMVIPVGPSLYSQELLRIRRLDASEFRQESLTLVRFVPLTGAFGWHG